MKMKPKCMDEKSPQWKEYGHSAKGFLVPCCWCDVITTKDDILLHNLYKEHLHLDNVDTIDEIIFSDEWQEFLDALKDYKTAPKVCKEYCSIDDDGVDRIFKKTVLYKK